jgi:predicted nuclease with TOPRIM domain
MSIQQIQDLQRQLDALKQSFDVASDIPTTKPSDDDNSMPARLWRVYQSNQRLVQENKELQISLDACKDVVKGLLDKIETLQKETTLLDDVRAMLTISNNVKIQQSDETPQYLSIRQAAKALGIGASVAYRAIDKKLPIAPGVVPIKLGTVWRVPKKQVDTAVKKLR